jgi:hypothetical protein
VNEDTIAVKLGGRCAEYFFLLLSLSIQIMHASLTVAKCLGHLSSELCGKTGCEADRTIF